MLGSSGMLLHTLYSPSNLMNSIISGSGETSCATDNMHYHLTQTLHLISSPSLCSAWGSWFSYVCSGECGKNSVGYVYGTCCSFSLPTHRLSWWSYGFNQFCFWITNEDSLPSVNPLKQVLSPLHRFLSVCRSTRLIIPECRPVIPG